MKENACVTVYWIRMVGLKGEATYYSSCLSFMLIKQQREKNLTVLD